MTDRMFTLKEAADYLRISDKTARKLIQDGSIKAAKIAGRWKVTPEDLQHFIASRQPGAE
jgi:excisionase family DNA binding protein